MIDDGVVTPSSTRRSIQAERERADERKRAAQRGAATRRANAEANAQALAAGEARRAQKRAEREAAERDADAAQEPGPDVATDDEAEQLPMQPDGTRRRMTVAEYDAERARPCGRIPENIGQGIPESLFR
jgi:hypothetical protein